MGFFRFKGNSRIGVSDNGRITIDGVEQIGDGTAPSNLILFENWVDGESVAIDTNTTDTTPPNNVTNLSTSNITTTGLTLSWTASTSTDVSGYEIYRGSTLLSTVTGTTYNVSGLITSTAYTFTVKTKDTSNNISNGISVNATTATPDSTAPENVTDLSSSNLSDRSVTLSWTASTSTDISSYDIYKDDVFLVNTANISYTITGLSPSTLYSFSVRAKDSSGNTSLGVDIDITTTADTTAPILTITPAATFTDTQQVIMSTNETATIWYTLDDTDPIESGTRVQYTAPLTLTDTDTIKAYAVDTTGNNSDIQTVTYTKSVTPTYLYLDMNGTSDYIKIPSLTFDEIVMDFHPEQNNTWQTYLDARGGVENSYIQNNASMADAYNASVWTGIYVDGGAKQTALNNNLVPRNTRTNIRFTLTTVGTDDVSIFSKFDNTEFMKGKIYDIKFKNAGVLVAHYDMTKGNVQDQSGNGIHATLTGGTFV